MKTSTPDGKEIVVGKFEITNIGEGLYKTKRFQLRKINLYVFAHVIYDDNMYVDGHLLDAISITLVITHHPTLNLAKSLSVGTTQVPYNKNFKEINIVNLVRDKNKLYDFVMKCGAKQRPSNPD